MPADPSPRPRLDSDNAERYDKLSRETGISLEAIVNMILRSAEFVEIKVENSDQRPVIGKVQQKKESRTVIMHRNERRTF